MDKCFCCKIALIGGVLCLTAVLLALYCNLPTNEAEKGKKNFSEFLAKKKLETPVFKKEQADLNGDKNKENYILENGRLTAQENSSQLWQSPSDWWVEDFVVADSTNDGILDLNISLWKAGNFGSSRPFWVKENDMGVKNHFFVLNYKNSGLGQIWGSSSLENPNCRIEIKDSNGDQLSELIVWEGKYTENFLCKPEFYSVWKWSGWGFFNESRTPVDK